MPTPPNLGDPAERAAYRQELRRYQLGFRRVSVGLAVLGALYTVARVEYALSWPAWPGRGAVIVGVVMMLAAIVLRSRYHARRMKGLR